VSTTLLSAKDLRFSEYAAKGGLLAGDHHFLHTDVDKNTKPKIHRRIDHGVELANHFYPVARIRDYLNPSQFELLFKPI
jgi:hypothetical protein